MWAAALHRSPVQKHTVPVTPVTPSSGTDSSLYVWHPLFVVVMQERVIPSWLFCAVTNNTVRSNLGIGGIAPRFYLPGGSSNLQLWVLAGGFDIQISPSSGGPPPNTLCHWTGRPEDPTSVPPKWRLNPLNVLCMVQCTNVTDDRPRSGEMCGYRRNRLR